MNYDVSRILSLQPYLRSLMSDVGFEAVWMPRHRIVLQYMSFISAALLRLPKKGSSNKDYGPPVINVGH